MRKLHKFRVWFQDVEGARFYKEIEAMNSESAIKKAQTALLVDETLKRLGEGREWTISLVQEMGEQRIAGFHTALIPSGQAPVFGTKPPATQKRGPGRPRKIHTEVPAQKA